MSPVTKRSMLIAAGAILVIALVWLALLEAKSPVRRLCGRLKEFGYSVSPGDFYLQGYGTDVSIRSLFEEKGITDEEAARLVELSRRCGFEGDIESAGKVELLMWQRSEDSVLLVYTLNGEPQLAFIETMPGREALPIDGQ